MSYHNIITLEPGKRGGKPCIRGLRMTVYDVLDSLAAGMTMEQILEDFDYLTRDDILACLAYAADRERHQWGIKPIRNDDDLRAAFLRLEPIFQAQEGTPEADERDVLVTLIEAYEQKHYVISSADPIEAIKFRMEQQGLTPKDLEPFIGGSGRVSEVLNHKRPLSLRMIKRLHEGLHIPYESLLAGGGR